MWFGKRKKALLACCLLVSGLLAGCGEKGKQEQETLLTGEAAASAENYKTYEVAPRDITKKSTMSLNVAYTQQQALCAPDGELYFEEMLVQYDDRLKAGDPIATFRRMSSQAELEKAQLDLQRAQEEEDALLEQLQNAMDMAGGTQWELAELAYDRAQDAGQRRLKALQEAVEQAQLAFEPVVLTAPYDCVINTITHLYDGQEVDTGTVIAQISHTASMALVGDALANTFQYGNDVLVEYGKRNQRKTVAGKVISSSRLLGENAQKAWIALEEDIDPALLVNPVASIETVQLRNALTVPRSAIETENDRSSVQILVDGTPHKRYIVRGISVGNTDDSQVVVLSGLKAGQQVIME